MTDQERKALRDHVLAPGHEFNSCRSCIERVAAKGYTKLRTIVNVRKPEKDKVEYISDLLSALR